MNTLLEIAMAIRRLFRRSAVFGLTFLVALSLYAQPKTLIILHTNDLHAAFMPHEALWVHATPKPLIGGFAELAYVADSVRKAVGPAIMLDAGDVMTGNPITERLYAGASGGALFEMMNRIHYDAWCIGNHDFDISQDNLRAITRIVTFPTLSANIVDDHGKFPVGNVPWTILNKGGLRIGVIGLISSDLYNLVSQKNLTGIRVLAPVETMQHYIDELSPRTDLLIALTHEGVDDDSVLAEGVHGLNIIVGGHSHTRLPVPKIVNGVVIVQTGSYCENLGELTVTVEHHTVVNYHGKLIRLWKHASLPVSPVSQLADSMQREIDKDFSEVLGKLEDDWKRGEGQTAIGTFVADAQRNAAAADVGFMNDYGIRRDVPAGPITKKTLFEVLPFRNTLVTFSLTGEQLRSIMEYNIAKHPHIQIAGMSGKWRRFPDGSIRFVSITVNGNPLDEQREYSCAASDYFVGEAQRYLGLEVHRPIYLSHTVFEVVAAAVRKAGTIDAVVNYPIEQVH
jgi:5'-nucleotidase/UDP-sugar diphosphatase